MKSSLIRFAAASALVLFLSACGGQKADSADSALMGSVEHLRSNDLRGFVNNALPEDALAKLRSEYEQSRSEEPSAQERAAFEQQMSQLTAADAETTLMNELRPVLRQYGPQIPMFVGFGQGMVISGIEESDQLDATQKADAVKTIQAIGTWLSSADLGNEEKAQQAVSVMVETARELNLETLDDVRALSFDDMLERASIGMAGAKEVLGVYGFSIDEVLSSMNAEVISTEGDAATVRVNYTLLGAPQSTQANMIRIDGNWYGRELIDGLNDN